MNYRNSIFISLMSLMLGACGGGGGGSAGSPGLPALRVADASRVEGHTGQAQMQFELTLDKAAADPVTVEYRSEDASAVAGEDYASVSGTLSIPAGSTRANLAVEIIGDGCFENDESFTLRLSNISSNAVIGRASATGNIENDDAKRRMSIADSEVDEGDTGITQMHFTVSLDQASCIDTSANYSVNALTADISDVDLVTARFTIPAGETQADIVVQVHGDSFYETDETLNVNIENPPAHIEVTDDEAFGTIRTDDYPEILIGQAQMVEGDSGNLFMVFPVGLTGVTNELSVHYATSDGTATLADNDYVAADSRLVIPAGETAASILIEIVGDTDEEPSELFYVTLSDLQGDAQLPAGLNQAAGIILDDDTPLALNPELSVEMEMGLESAAGSSPVMFKFFLNQALAQDVVLDYATADLAPADRSASAGVDYTPVSGRLRIHAGDTYAEVPVAVLDDTDTEAAIEYFSMNLTLVSNNVTLLTPALLGAIFDDEYTGPPVLTMSSTSSTVEGNSGIRILSLPVVLTVPSTTEVTVDYRSEDGTALAGSDYTAVSGTLHFAIGETQKTIDIPIHGDTVIEADELFVIRLSNATGNAVLSYDPLLPPQVEISTDEPFAMVSIADVGQREGDNGTSEMLFTVTIDAVAGDPVTMNYVTVDDSALQGEDYVAASGSVSIPAGQTQATIAVSVNGDTDNEYDEAFIVQLSNVTQNAEFADDNARGLIVNDDNSGGWSTPQAMSQEGQDNIMPKIAMNASGDVRAVWYSESRLLHEGSSYDSSNGWSVFDDVTGYTSRDCDLAMDDSARSTLAYVFSRATVVDHSPSSGWSTQQVLDPSSYANQEFMNLASNAGGDKLAVWKLNTAASYADDEIMYSRYDPLLDQWSTPAYVSTNEQYVNGMHLAMKAGGDAVLIWVAGSGAGVMASFYDALNDTWSVGEPIGVPLNATLYAAGYAPQVAMDDNGNAIAVWDSALGVGTGVRGDVWARRYVAATGEWGSLFQLELSSADGTDAQIAMDASGNAMAVWFLDNNLDDPWNDSFEIHARRYDVSTDSWSTDMLVQNSDTRVSQFGFDNHIPLDRPALAMDPAGNAILAWSEKVEDNFVIRASRYVPAEAQWSAPEIISGSDRPFAIFPVIGVDASGSAQVIWMGGDSEYFDVYSGDISEIWGSRFTP